MNWLGQGQDIQLEIFAIAETFSDKSPSLQLSFEVMDVESCYVKLCETGVQVMVEPLQTEAGKICYLMDPDGRSIELIQSN